MTGFAIRCSDNFELCCQACGLQPLRSGCSSSSTCGSSSSSSSRRSDAAIQSSRLDSSGVAGTASLTHQCVRAAPAARLLTNLRSCTVLPPGKVAYLLPAAHDCSTTVSCFLLVRSLLTHTLLLVNHHSKHKSSVGFSRGLDDYWYTTECILRFDLSLRGVGGGGGYSLRES